MIIQISPKLEDWILNRARQHHISPNEYGLPVDPNELHKIPHYERTIKFQRFLKALLEKGDDEIETLKEWLSDYS